MDIFAVLSNLEKILLYVLVWVSAIRSKNTIREL